MQILLCYIGAAVEARKYGVLYRRDLPGLSEGSSDFGDLSDGVILEM